MKIDNKLISKILDVVVVALLAFALLLLDSDIEKLESDLKLREQEIVELKEDVAVLNSIIENITIETEWTPQYTNIPLHENESSFKSYMDYRTITDQTSRQYQLIYSDSITVGSDGLLYSGEYVGVALGSKFGEIGDKFLITLNTGKQFKAIKVDEKDDSHTVDGCHHKVDGSVVEFVINIDLAQQSYPLAITMGNFDYIDKFNGTVVKIEREVQ